MTAFVTAKRMAFGFASVWLLSLTPAHAQSVDLNRTLKGIETRYNSAQTLELQFSESYGFKGRKKTESGTLFLRKPGRMRWQYTNPAGKLFVSDGQYFYYYNPEDNHAEKLNVKEAEDLRAPLAFLLGKLNFNEDFREYHTSMAGADALISATPKSDKLPFTEVTFLTAPDFTIKQLQVKGQDGSLLEYAFQGEKKNPAVPDAMFKFSLPPGAEWVDSSKN
jgi:outer membrane lipoprotein carrier protein